MPPRRRARWPPAGWFVPSASASTPKRHIDVPEERRIDPHQAVTSGRWVARHGWRTVYKIDDPPTLLRYTAPGFGVGELWILQGACCSRSFRARRESGPSDSPLRGRLEAFFAGEADDVRGRRARFRLRRLLRCLRARAARGSTRRGRHVRRGLPALAGHPGAAGAAGTFCARNRLRRSSRSTGSSPASGIGFFGSLGVDYKRRMLALEHVAL